MSPNVLRRASVPFVLFFLVSAFSLTAVAPAKALPLGPGSLFSSTPPGMFLSGLSAKDLLEKLFEHRGFPFPGLGLGHLKHEHKHHGHDFIAASFSYRSMREGSGVLVPQETKPDGEVIPEPSSALVFALGLGIAGYGIRRRMRAEA